jgi:Tol biopolymer transport system component
VRPKPTGCAALLLLVTALPLVGCGDRVSRGQHGEDPNGASGQPSTWLDIPSSLEVKIYVAFASRASNLVAQDTNGQSDVFLYVGAGSGDSGSATVRRIGVKGASAQGNGPSADPSVSQRAEHVSLTSRATNLVPDDTNATSDVFVVDTATDAVQRVSVASGGQQADGASRASSITANGRYVAFVSAADNLVAGDHNGRDDVFVRDLQAHTTTRVSVDSHGADANGSSSDPAIAGGGRYVAFASRATDLVHGDTNRRTDVFVRDLKTGKTTRISASPHGRPGAGSSTEPTISPDGRLVAFTSSAANLVAHDANRQQDVFVRDRKSGTTRLVSVNRRGTPGNGASSQPSLLEGGYLAFTSAATNLVSGDRNRHRDVFVTSRLHRDKIFRASEFAADEHHKTVGGNADSFAPSLSYNGGVLVVAFTTDASNLGYADHNHLPDVLFTGNLVGQD